MKIGIDARTLYLPELRGIGKMLLDLLEALGSQANGHEFVLYYQQRPDLVDRAPRHPSMRTHAVQSSHQTVLEQWVLPRAVASDRCDLFHSPANTTCWRQPCPVVLTLHDLMGYDRARHAGPLGRRLDWRVIQPRAYRRVRRIITASTYSKEQAMQKLGIPAEKIRVVPHGIHPRYRPAEAATVEQVLRQHGVTQPYVLVTGGETPRKNLPRILEAMHALWSQRLLGHQLVVTGVNPMIRERLLAQFPWVAHEQRLRLLGYVDEEELVPFYSGADVFVYASLDEGFGLPPLEAMACGTPAIASNATSIPETVGNAALLINPMNIEEIAEAIRRLARDEALRHELVERGFAHVRGFTWDRAARETLAVYEEAVNASASGVAR